MKLIKEGKAEFYASEANIVNKKMEAFFNPEMKYVRDTTIAVLSTSRNQLRIALPLAGSGARAIRLLKELPNKISYIYCNDHDKKTFKILKKNKEEFGNEKMFIACEEADEFLLYRKSFDYIDLDPYGSPNPFLDSAIKRISNNGIIGVTATDIKALAGTARQGGLRKYGAYPERGNHERGLRNLARKVISVGAQYDKAMIPLLSISNNHYYRIFFEVQKSKSKSAELLEKKFSLHGEGAIRIIRELKKINNEKINELLLEEAKSGLTINNHFDIHVLCKKYNVAQLPTIEKIFAELKKKKYKACRSHISPTAIWTDASEEDVRIILKPF
jgi:tRNA (guanine26-N2/guanine27-N2)-dimethyltransferase